MFFSFSREWVSYVSLEITQRCTIISSTWWSCLLCPANTPRSWTGFWTFAYERLSLLHSLSWNFQLEKPTALFLLPKDLSNIPEHIHCGLRSRLVYCKACFGFWFHWMNPLNPLIFWVSVQGSFPLDDDLAIVYYSLCSNVVKELIFVLVQNVFCYYFLYYYYCKGVSSWELWNCRDCGSWVVFPEASFQYFFVSPLLVGWLVVSRYAPNGVGGGFNSLPS